MDFSSDATLNWLLEPTDPGVRARTLVALCGAEEDSPAVMEARRVAVRGGPVAEILAHQQEQGGWESSVGLGPGLGRSSLAGCGVSSS